MQMHISIWHISRGSVIEDHALKGAPAFMLYCNRGRQLEPSVCSIEAARQLTSGARRRPRM
eukprot:scaffold133285_cov77-Phaeocystis_antarctica.AAC.2